MSVFMDLNLSYTEDKSSLQRLIETAAQRESAAVSLLQIRSLNLRCPSVTAEWKLTALASGLMEHICFNLSCVHCCGCDLI